MVIKKTYKQVIIDFIISCLKNGEQRGPILRKAGKKWGTSKSAFDRLLKIAKEQHAIQAETIKKELAAVDKQAAIEGAKSGIKTKNDRILYYQSEIQRMYAQLIGDLKFTFVVGNSIKNSHNEEKFMLPVHIQNDIRITIKHYQSEISKMEGDYTPIKIAQTDTSGNDIIFKLDERFDNH